MSSPYANNYPNLSNAPIEEAIISLTLGNQKHLSLVDVEATCAELFRLYPIKKEWRRFNTTFQVSNDGVNTSTAQGLNQGFILSAEDQKNVLSVSQDMLSLNRLRPYGSWENFSEEYERAWEIYTAPIIVEEINQLIIRYINSFTIPQKGWEDYLLMRPVLQSSSEYDISVMSMTEAASRYVLVSERHMANAVVLLTIKPEDFNNLRVIMDVEVQSQRGISNYSSYHVIIDTLNRLRDFKNQIFFSNLPQAKEQFS